MENDIVAEYKSSLSDLNCNSKPMINMLTILAEENIKVAPHIVQAIENHIKKVGAEFKLPVLYLIDSIIKNVGRDYLNHFSERIVSIFSSVFEKVDESTRVLLYKLRHTWTEVVPNKTLYAIDVSVSRMDPAWPVTSQPPVKSIHINPKFLTATSRKHEESVPVRQMESKLKEREEEVFKQLLAKHERKRRINEEAIEAEKRNNTTVRNKGPVVVHVQPSEAAPVERSVPQKLDPRLAQRDPRLQKSNVPTNVHKGLPEDKSVKNNASAVKSQQVPQQKHSSLPSVVLVPSTSFSQTREVEPSASSKNDRKIENSIESSKRKVEKSVPALATNFPNEQTKPEEPSSIKRFPSPQKQSSEQCVPEIQDKAQKGQDLSHKTKLDASPSKNKSSAAKEKLLNVDSKHPLSNKSSTIEKSKVDVKDLHVEIKHIVRSPKGSSKASLEPEKSSETYSSRNRSKTTADDRRTSPRHRSRSPLHDEDRKKDSKSSKIPSRSSRHLPMERSDIEKIENSQEPTVIKNIPPDNFPKVDTDLRVSSRSSISPEKSVKGSSKRDNSTIKENENQENVLEPPVKKAKDEKENKNSENVSWFGNQDQDYRCKESGNKINNQQGWAQYKAVHPDEFKSPLRPARENMENIGPSNEDFRETHDKLLPKHSQPEQHMIGGCISETEYDRLGRPRLNRRRNDIRFRGRRGRRYNQFLPYESFYHNHNDKGYDVSMLSNPQFIIRQAEERFRAGIITEDCFRDIRDGLEKMTDSARKLGFRVPSINIHSMYPRKFYEQDEFRGSQMRHMNKPHAAVPPPAIPPRIKGFKPVPSSRSSFELDNVTRHIHFIDDKAIVVIDGVPRQIVLKGQPTQVFIKGMSPITVKFDGKPVRFEVDGKMHAMRFGVPTRELYIDDCPYRGKFGGQSFFVNIDGKVYSVQLGTPIPEVVFLEEPQQELYKKFLEEEALRNDPDIERVSPIPEKDIKIEGKGVITSFPIKTEDTDFRSTDNERAVSGTTASGSVPLDVDMRTVAIKEKSEEGKRNENYDSQYTEVTENRNVSDMKDVDWRHHPSPMNFDPPVRDHSCYPPLNVDFAAVKDSCRPGEAPPDSMVHPGLPRNQIIKSEVEPNFGKTFTDSNSQMHQNIWNGPISCDSVEDSRNNSERQKWESNQERIMAWQESGPRHSQLPLQPHDRLLPRIPSMPNWRGNRFTPPYSQNEPADCSLPPRVIAPQQPNWRQPLENLNENNPNMPGWEWKQRGFRPDVPPVLPLPQEPGHPYNMQRNESNPPFENYVGPYEQLRPPPLPPRGLPHIRMMGNQMRPEVPVQQVLRPPVSNSDLQNPRLPLPHQRPWLPRNLMENVPPATRECPLLQFPHPPPLMSGPSGNPQMRTSLPPPPLPPNLPNIPVSLQGPVQFKLTRVPSPVVSEMSTVKPNTSQSHVPSHTTSEVVVKSEPVDASSCQGSVQDTGAEPQQFTSQATQQTSSQGSNVNSHLQNTDCTVTNEVAPSSSVTPPNFLDLSTLMERLIAAGIITKPPNQSEKMDVVEQDVKNETENTHKEEPTPPIDFTTESLKTRHSAVISALFRGTQCASCGMRFKDTHGEHYSRHLDWHFRVNRREKDGAKKAFSRKWYYDVEDWIQFEEFEDFEERARSFFELQADEELLQTPATVEVPTVSATHGNETEVCVVCGEAFQLLWVEEEEEWHLKDAVREDGEPYHPLCFEDFKKASEVPDTPVDETPSADVSLEGKEQESADKDAVTSAEDGVPKDSVETENCNAEEVKEIKEDVSEKEDVKEPSATVMEGEETSLVKEEPMEEEEPLEGKPGEEEIIGLIPESDMEEEERKEQPNESKMVVLGSGGIVMKVRAESIQQPASPAPPVATDKDAEQKKEDSEEEFRPPTPDPRFKVLPPVKRGTELSGLCSIM